ncbi:unnamed protein product [Microthlaspi erraticum]|uniref:Uncharacterized protein n=1 Tax=Microthlaspi erraticum TaxID=1685480 RepID=A0A6D2KBK5_9BRAS|nr:unnamed protein product [Microthlaspi erraticum]
MNQAEVIGTPAAASTVESGSVEAVNLKSECCTFRRRSLRLSTSPFPTLRSVRDWSVWGGRKKTDLGCANEHLSEMLFAAEGGGFFSSSASGYSNGLALLLLGQKSEQKPIRWNHYHLVVEETDTKSQPKNWLSCRCSSLTCFGRRKSETTEDDPSPPIRVNPEGKKDDDNAPPPPSVDYNCEVSTNRFALKSSLKKRSFSDAVLADGDDDHRVSRDGVLEHVDRRKVQWPDTCGIEIAEVREFEPSEVDESDDEFHHGSGKSCMCTIM